MPAPAPSPMQTDTQPGKPRGWLKSIFNKESLIEMGVGAGISFAAKTTVLACTASFAAPAAGLAGAVALAGAASALGRHYFKYFRAKGEAREALKLTPSQAFKKAALGAGVGLVGGAIGYGLSELYHHFFPAGCLEKIAQVAPVKAPVPAAIAPHPAELASAPAPHAAVPEPIHPATVTPPPAPVSALDAVTGYADHHKLSAKALDALARAHSANHHIAAQGLDDLGVMRYNGTNGFEKIQQQGVELFRKAAALGNLKARVDLTELKYHGNPAAGIKADREAAIDKMIELSKHSKRAAVVVRQWFDGPVNPVEPAAAPVVAPATPSPLDHAPVVAPAAPVHDLSAAAPGQTAVDIHPAQAAPTAQITPATPPAVAAPVAPASGPDCQAVINTITNDISFICKAGADLGVKIGDQVTIQRPALLPVMR